MLKQKFLSGLDLRDRLNGVVKIEPVKVKDYQRSILATMNRRSILQRVDIVGIPDYRYVSYGQSWGANYLYNHAVDYARLPRLIEEQRRAFSHSDVYGGIWYEMSKPAPVSDMWDSLMLGIRLGGGFTQRRQNQPVPLRKGKSIVENQKYQTMKEGRQLYILSKNEEKTYSITSKVEPEMSYLFDKLPTFMPEELIGLSEPEIIEMIHSEVDAGTDHAWEIIEHAKQQKPPVYRPIAKELTDIAERCEDLGFVNVPEVRKAHEIELENQTITQRNAHRARLIEEAIQLEKDLIHFKNAYPFIKTMRLADFRDICKKYSLIYAPVKNYIKSVPVEKIKEMEQAQPLCVADTPKECFKYDTSIRVEKVLSLEETLDEFGLRGSMDFPRMTVSEFKKAVNKQMEYKFYSRRELVDGPKGGLMIAAPADHFDLVGLEFTDGMEYVEPIITDDPIVFRHVKGGLVQIISKWGEESKDSLLLLAAHN